MTTNVTLKAVKDEITRDDELRDAPVVMKRDAILAFIEIIEDHPEYTLTARSRDAIVKYAHSMVKGE